MTLPTITYRGRTFTVLFPDLLRPLHGEERERLRASILADGVQVGVLVDEHDGIIEGRNRVTLAAELDVDLPVVVRAGLSDEQKLRLALDLNDARRQLTPADRKQAQARAEELRKERIARVAEASRQGKSTRTIAQEEGVSQKQVMRDLNEQVSPPDSPDTPVSPASAPATVKGADGKTYPASRKGGATQDPAAAARRSEAARKAAADRREADARWEAGMNKRVRDLEEREKKLRDQIAELETKNWKLEHELSGFRMDRMLDDTLGGKGRNVITRWFRDLAKQYHPDKGGSEEIMAVLSHAKDTLLAMLKG
jgi:hypothetical protein